MIYDVIFYRYLLFWGVEVSFVKALFGMPQIPWYFQFSSVFLVEIG